MLRHNCEGHTRGPVMGVFLKGHHSCRLLDLKLGSLDTFKVFNQRFYLACLSGNANFSHWAAQNCCHRLRQGVLLHGDKLKLVTSSQLRAQHPRRVPPAPQLAPGPLRSPLVAPQTPPAPSVPSPSREPGARRGRPAPPQPRGASA